MPVIDEIREEQKKFKNMTLKEKAGYIWDYYKIHIIVSIFLIIFAVMMTRDIYRNSMPVHLNAIVVNSNFTYDSEASLPIAYVNYADIDTKKENYMIDYSMHIIPENFDQTGLAYQQKIMAMFASNELDIMIADRPLIESFADVDAYVNLEEFLPDDLKQELEDKGYTYYTYPNEQTVSDANAIAENREPAPVGIHMKNCTRMNEDGDFGTYFEESDPIFTIAINSERRENAIEFLRFLISQDEPITD